MITYELAKKLKDAGFPQDTEWILYNSPTYYERWIRILYRKPGTTSNTFEVGSTELSCPTLSELIDACGKNFRMLSYDQPYVQWVAHGERENKKDISLFTNDGKTPEEAVANLWLELNKKI